MPAQTDSIIEAVDICHSYREGRRTHRVLDGASLRVAPGESVAIRGRSGSGKSTLLNILGAIDKPDAGSVRIAGTDITALSERDRTLFRRRTVGFVYQAFNLIPTLDVADNIGLVLELNGITGAKAAARIDELLSAVGLDAWANRYPDTLSGGEQQRVAIARALAHRPAVLIADEPTGNLDEQTADQVLALLKTLSRDSGVAMVIATHSAALAAACDRRLDMHNGRLEPVD